MKKITEQPEWQALCAHQQHIVNQHMQDWFAADPSRYGQYSLEVDGILLDYSKNRFTQATLTKLCDLAKAADLSTHIEALFNGHAINVTEKRPALHTALRNRSGNPLWLNGQNITALVQSTLQQLEHFAETVRQGDWRGVTGQPITDIINIGIGGSHLGPLLTTRALADYGHPRLRCHFISNIDTAHLHEVLNQINPATSLFIVSSKSFTTLETLTNAETIKMWLLQQLTGSYQSKQEVLAKHFVAVTADAAKAIAFGIAADAIFPLWEWVGGRYSVWSAIGLPLILLIGMKNFLDFLAGAHAMDDHFRHAPLTHNMPVILALLGIWYINFFGAYNHAIVPYSHHLTNLWSYLQQADMESNGKSTSHHGLALDYATGPVIWGEQGCNAQHAFHQLLHQGHHFIPVDFILVGKVTNELKAHHDILIASGLSQAQALMQGKSFDQAFTELKPQGLLDQTETEMLARHKSISGNRPSNILFLPEITPRHLGALLALYEHKIFVQGTIWQINSFDQWGVELGKQLLPKILADLDADNSVSLHDSSTSGLIQHFKKLRSEV